MVVRVKCEGEVIDNPNGPLHMSPVTWLARLPGPELCSVFIWEISARSTGMNLRNTTKMVEHKLIVFPTVRTLWTLVTLLIKLYFAS